MRISNLFAFGALATAALAAGNSSKPNFVIVLTDDQDLQMDSLNYMEGVKHFITEQGTTFAHHFCTVALCCPSRVNMWTGKAAHNTNVTDLKPPYGGYPKFIEQGYYNKWLPVWLQKAGYKTYFAGKFLNSHNIINYREKLNQLGLDGHDFMLEPGTYQYVNTTFQHNEGLPKNYPGVYATDLLANKSLDWIDIAVKNDEPFFLAINPVNPHANQVFYDGYHYRQTAPIPAERYKNLFPNVTVPRKANFNPNVSSGAGWVRELDRLNSSEIASNDDWYRKRLQALQAVDDLVNRTIARLQDHNVLDNTYFIYTSDNGFHVSQHRLSPGKRCPYEEDISVPMIIRGPGVPKNASVDLVTSHTDLAPTIVELAGATGPGDFDGSVMPVHGQKTNTTEQPWEHVQVELWGEAVDTQNVTNSSIANTYKAIRVLSGNYSLFYSVWCSGDHEVYDMLNDAQQMHNLYNSSAPMLGVSMDKLVDRLDALTLVLKTCKGDSCRLPWKALDPSGKTNNLMDALNPQYDAFYAGQAKVSFNECALGYFVDNELPIKYNTYGGGSADPNSYGEMYADHSNFG